MSSDDVKQKSIKCSESKPPRIDCDPANIPAELKRFRQWVMWNWVWDKKRGYWDKPPFSVDGHKCNHLDPANQVPFETALAASKNFDGIGLSLGENGIGLVGLDIDSCRDRSTGLLSIEAQAIVDELDTYWEISPSGEGIRGFLRGDYDKAKWGSEAGILEIYRDKRYLTITGNLL